MIDSLSYAPRSTAHVITRTGLRILLLCASVLFADFRPATAESIVEIPVLAAIQANDRGVFEVLLLRWDRQPNPSPIVLTMAGRQHPARTEQSQFDGPGLPIRPRPHVDVDHTGTVSAIGIAYASTGSDGPSAGAVMTVGFAALLKGDRIQRGMAMTGTITKDGTIGPVGGIPDKIRAAVREGYRIILIPEGQRYDPRWNIDRLAWDLDVR